MTFISHVTRALAEVTRQSLDRDFCVRTTLQKTGETMSTFSTTNSAKLQQLTRSLHIGSIIKSVTRGASPASTEQSAPVKPAIDRLMTLCSLNSIDKYIFS